MKMKMFRRYAMRAGVVALCSAALCTVPMLAQAGGGAPGGGGGGGGRGGMTPDAQLAQLTTALTLSADQQAKIKPILDADAKKIADLRAVTPPDPDMRTKMTAIRTAQHATIKALLTADQATKYDAMPQGGGGRGGGGGAPAAPPQ